jgi:hypothetical protein
MEYWKSSLSFISRSLKNPKVIYVHLISGQDWPVMSLDKLYNVFENNSKIYLGYKLTKKNKIWAKYVIMAKILF